MGSHKRPDMQNFLDTILKICKIAKILVDLFL